MQQRAALFDEILGGSLREPKSRRKLAHERAARDSLGAPAPHNEWIGWHQRRSGLAPRPRLVDDGREPGNGASNLAIGLDRVIDEFAHRLKATGRKRCGARVLGQRRGRVRPRIRPRIRPGFGRAIEPVGSDRGVSHTHNQHPTTDICRTAPAAGRYRWTRDFRRACEGEVSRIQTSRSESPTRPYTRPSCLVSRFSSVSRPIRFIWR